VTIEKKDAPAVPDIFDAASRIECEVDPHDPTKLNITMRPASESEIRLAALESVLKALGEDLDG